MYTLLFTRSAEKEIEEIPEADRSKLLKKIARLRHPKNEWVGAKPIHGLSNGWRLRMGDYRAIFTVDEIAKNIEVIAAGNRSNIYKKHGL